MCVLLFGSLARNEGSPRSDADVCILLRDHPERRWFRRIPEFGGMFEDVGVAVDLFPYTLEELRNGVQQAGFFRQALREGEVLTGQLPSEVLETAGC